ncbi:replication initiator [Nocardia sp. N2S4-5]|uniref:replication initiator n=1 Tax=Nocardia sp. N2S4-5 TaxID=3351565 RepID=UPI0037D82E41
MTTRGSKLTATQPDPANGSDREVMPDFEDIAHAVALEHGVCVRPMVLEQYDTETGRTELVPVPCGHTLESVCPPCARKARALRMTQCREGWHLTREPVITTRPATFDQKGLLQYRADLQTEHDRLAGLVEAGETSDPHTGLDAERMHTDITELVNEIHWADRELKAYGMRGNAPRPDQASRTAARHRSTRRRHDAPDLPRLPVSRRTVGREYAGKFIPSMMMTFTLPSYGAVHPEDGTPLDPDTYDYRRAARDAIHWAALLDRLIQNLRRCVGWSIQYFGTVEPQRRGAPHAHLCARGTIPHRTVRQAAAATYHHVWWPPHDTPVYSEDRKPLWDRASRTFVDPDTGEPLTGWDDAVDALTEPAHTVRFGEQVHSRGVLGGSEEARRHIKYVCKYLLKSVSEVLDARTARQWDHYDRLHAELVKTPCSERCPVWLLYGIVPKQVNGKTVPGRCRARAHQAATLGLPGRRVLVSRRWSGKRLGDHKADRIAFVRRALAHIGIVKTDQEAGRYQWSTLAPGTPTPPRAKLLMHGVAQRIAWRVEYERALLAAQEQPPPGGERGGGDISSPPPTSVTSQLSLRS